MEIKEPFFSVIIPTTGGRLENLELVLTSLANQWFPKSLYEVIVVNDGGEKEAYNLTMGFADAFYGADIKKVSYYAMGQVRSTEGTMLDIQPRNKGTEFALGDYYIFADSDIILCPTTLACYFQDMIENPDRIVLGVYHWLYPMHVTPDDVTSRFYGVINERLAKKLLTEVEPDNQQTHNICRDMRMKDFDEFSPDQVFTKPGHINVALACYSGNICWPKHIFEDIGGYTPYLHAGAHEDGFSGVTAYRAGHGISFDRRIIGGHLYHHRNIEYIMGFKWPELNWFNAQFTDFDEMTDIIAATEEEKKRLGVADWKEKGELGW
jgi:glycosyltransferase involved in cell wall biosynthesis